MLTYYIASHDQGPEDAQELRSDRIYGRISDDPETFAEQAAEYCQNYRDGWEWTWPEIFVILNDGEEVGRFEVTREAVPHFNATKVEANNRDDRRRAPDSAQTNGA